MDNDNRVRDRQQNFEIAELVARDQAGNEEVHSIMLRDESPKGVGGVFVGPKPLDPEGSFALRRRDGTTTNTRIIWMKKVADYVSLLGMETSDG